MSDPTLFDTRPSPGSDVMVGNRAGRQVETVELAYARTSDPDTSHEAAASLSSERIRQSQEAVLSLFRHAAEPMDDKTLVRLYQTMSAARPDLYLPQADSGIRTRRNELVKKGLIIFTGERVKVGDKCHAKVWKLAPRSGPDPFGSTAEWASR